LNGGKGMSRLLSRRMCAGDAVHDVIGLGGRFEGRADVPENKFK
jgi:hypothetical protein